MSISKNITKQDKLISRIFEVSGPNKISALFEAYRVSGPQKEGFVAALIHRLCFVEINSQSFKGGIMPNTPDPKPDDRIPIGPPDCITKGGAHA
ncbi:MAG: hypothetical protein ACN6OM_03975 [Alcaligenes nematophilus]|uniref:hypothetical protein n=1 Tax=Alcaligenes nematophilus TaxID=2994643 RepID=UPI003D009812